MDDRVIRIPRKTRRLIARLRKARVQMAHEQGRAPTDDDLAELLGCSLSRICWLLALGRGPASLDSCTLRDSRFPAPELAAETGCLRQRLERALCTLTRSQRTVLRLRYGLADGLGYTTDEVARLHRVSRQRICGIEACALARLRHPSRRETLAGTGE